MNVLSKKISNKGGKLFFIILFFLVFFSFFTFLFSKYVSSYDSDNLSDYSKGITEKNKSETIYKNVNCSGYNCIDEGRKLFSFHGINANCEELSDEAERFACYFRHSYQDYKCGEIKDKAERDKCNDSYRKYPYYYYLGPAGSLIAQRGFWIGGWRTYILGFNFKKEHYIMTEADEAFKALTLRENSRDLEFAGDLNTWGTFQLTSSSTGIYFGAKPEYDEIRYDEKYKGQAIVTKNTANAIRAPKYQYSYLQDLAITANYQAILKTPYGGVNGRLGGKRATASFEKGVYLEDWPFKISNQESGSEALYFNNKRVQWTELPIMGKYILYFPIIK